jgi:hypothetical protein
MALSEDIKKLPILHVEQLLRANRSSEYQNRILLVADVLMDFLHEQKMIDMNLYSRYRDSKASFILSI